MPTMTRDNNTDVPEADRDWFGGRRWTGIAALGVLILIGLCAVLLVVLHHSSTSSTAAPTQPASGAVSMPATSSSTLSTAPASALPTTPPTVAPAGTHWSIYETVALPSIAGQGPAHIDGAIATGYAHTPTGALLAAVNEGSRYGLAPDSQWRSAAAQMLEQTAPGYGVWLKNRAANPYGSQGATGGAQLAQIAGFQFVSYTSSDAVVQIVTRDSSGTLQVGADHVVWNGSDWRYVLAPDGGPAANVQQANDLGGFIEWAGV